MDDTIYRQDAIDALMAEVNYVGVLDGDDIKIVFDNLPSAQPEAIRCKDCKWCEDADGLMCKNTASWVVATDCDFGCVLAERKDNG